MPTLLPFSRSETLSHCRRVCALARETAHILNLGEAADVALGIAASLHHLHGAASVAAILDGFPGISNEGLALAERILVRVSGNTSSGNDLVEISTSSTKQSNSPRWKE